LAEAVKKQIGSEGKEFAAARRRAQAKQEKIGKIINNLLDNITSTNREYVEPLAAFLLCHKHCFEIPQSVIQKGF